ncbi:MAG: putative Ig domain-containing protein [Nanoarchaeota archaeon]|nr:putative Ig domain-containing protein [Nanoarchaeota archaeon]
MKFNNFLIFLVLLVVFISACNQTSSPQPSATTFQPAAWLSGQPGFVNLTPAEGNGPFQCAITAGALPAGFALNNCVISGRAPVLAGGTTKSVSPQFTITITDSAGQKQNLEYNILTLASLPGIIFNEPGTCIVNQQCDISLIANVNGGTPPYHFQSDTFRNGAPPMGMIVDVNGVLTGTPSKAGQYTFGVCVADSLAASKCGQTQVFVEEESETMEASDFETDANIPKEQKEESWSGTLTGTNDIKAHCVEGSFSYSFKTNFDFKGSLINAIKQESSCYDDCSGTGTISGTASISNQVQTSKYYPDCKLVDGSVSEIITISAGSEIKIRSEAELITGYLQFDANTKDNAAYGPLVLNVKDIASSTVSGTWGTGQFGEYGPHGTFTLTKQ